LHERTSLLRYTYIASLVLCFSMEGLTENHDIFYGSVSQPPDRGPVPDPGINYTGPRGVLLEFVILVF